MWLRGNLRNQPATSPRAITPPPLEPPANIHYNSYNVFTTSQPEEDDSRYCCRSPYTRACHSRIAPPRWKVRSGTSSTTPSSPLSILPSQTHPQIYNHAFYCSERRSHFTIPLSISFRCHIVFAPLVRPMINPTPAFASNLRTKRPQRA